MIEILETMIHLIGSAVVAIALVIFLMWCVLRIMAWFEETFKW